MTMEEAGRLLNRSVNDIQELIDESMLDPFQFGIPAEDYGSTVEPVPCLTASSSTNDRDDSFVVGIGAIDAQRGCLTPVSHFGDW